MIATSCQPVVYAPDTVLRATARSAKCVLVILILSVRPSFRLSVCLSQPGTETPGFHRLIAQRSSLL